MATRWGIAAEIAQNVLRPAERRFSVNDPILTKQSAQECGEPSRVSQRFEWAIQAQFMLAIEPAEAGNILVPRKTRLRALTGKKNAYRGRIQRE